MSGDDKKNLGEQEGKSQAGCDQVLLGRPRNISLPGSLGNPASLNPGSLLIDSCKDSERTGEGANQC